MNPAALVHSLQMATSSFSFGGDLYRLLSGSSYVNRGHTMVIKVLSKSPDVACYQELAALIPHCMFPRVEAIELNAPVTTGLHPKRFGILMPYIPNLKTTCTFISDASRLSLYMQIIDTLLAALPSFDVHSGCSLASVFWWREDGQLVLLNPMRLFCKHRGTLQHRLARIGRMMEKVDCVIAQSPGDTIFELLVDLKQSIRFLEQREQIAMIGALARAVHVELVDAEPSACTRLAQIELSLSIIK